MIQDIAKPQYLITPLDLAYAEGLRKDELEWERLIVTARRYHDGNQFVPMTRRMQKILGLAETATADMIFKMNVTRSIVTAVTERLIIAKFDSTDTDLSSWADAVMAHNELSYRQDEIHENALRDGESFIIVDWDSEANLPVFLPQPRYTSVESGGDGFGCLMKYPENDPNRPAEFAVKIWHEDVKMGFSVPASRERQTYYFSDHIEKWGRDSHGILVKVEEDVPWVDAEGNPLGIPVIHFKNKRMRLEAQDGWPVQNAINKTFIDLLSAADMTAFRIFVALGWIPTTDGKEPAEDGSNWLVVEPGQIVGTTKEPTKASFEAIDPADMKPLVDLTEQLILWMAMVTDTPVNRFVSTRQIASDKTLKEQEGPLLAKVRNRQLGFGSSWIKCLNMGRKLHNYFVAGEDLPLDSYFRVQWTEAQPSAQQDKIDILKGKKDLGIPNEVLWAEAGYSQAEIDNMKQLQGEVSNGRTTGSESG